MKKLASRTAAIVMAVWMLCSSSLSVLAESGVLPISENVVDAVNSEEVVDSSIPPESSGEEGPTSDLDEESSVPSETSGEESTTSGLDEDSSLPDTDSSIVEVEDPSSELDDHEDEDGHENDEDEEPEDEDESVLESFVPLQIVDYTDSLSLRPDDEATLEIVLNRDDVAVEYLWQKQYVGEIVEPEREILYEYSESDDTSYFFPFEDITEEELLEWNPDATWPGIELYMAALEEADGDHGAVHIEQGEYNYIVEEDEEQPDRPVMAMMAVAGEEDQEQDSEWEDIEGADDGTFSFVVSEEDAETVYRCVVTIVDNDYLEEAEAAAAEFDAYGEFIEQLADEELAEIEAMFETELISPEIQLDVRIGPDNAVLMAAAMNNGVNNVKYSNGWIIGVDSTMEYITEDTYTANPSASAARNLLWTDLGSNGLRADGSKYLKATLTNDNKLPVLSAWYGKTVYFRLKGSSGVSAAKKITIPAYTGYDYATGNQTLYKEAVSVLDVFVPETPFKFYSNVLGGVQGANSSIVSTNSSIVITNVPLTPNKGKNTYSGRCFNENADGFLKDAEGNFRFDSIIVGTAVGEEPDLSGAAAWALRDYIASGYGMVSGHDMLYAYGGVTNSSYVPSKTSTATPYYKLNTRTDGHWNMNWLVGVNKMYTEASPFEAASMVLAAGDYRDKSTLYGDGDVAKNSTLRIANYVSGKPLSDVSVRTPTNYPYNSNQYGNTFSKGFKLVSHSTHSNQQIAYGTVWLDFDSNTISQSGLGRLITDKRGDGLTGTNNFYLTTNGNFAMNQIGHIIQAGDVEGNATVYIDEARILANTIMYVSQRQQCQVCQSKQGGNTQIHFVHRIYDAAELAKIGDPNYWFTHPADGCYMLAANITLPENWTPIKNFRGHFSADNFDAIDGRLANFRVTLNSKGTPLFDNTTGTLGQYTNSSSVGWNLGTDKTKGLNTVVNSSGARATGVARVTGYLADLLGGSNADWANCLVVVKGTDGKDYYAITNIDGKYVISNVPCTGVMNAYVYKTNKYSSSPSGGVSKNGSIRVNVLPEFWDTNDTTQLYLRGYKPVPVKDTTVYEEQEAFMLEGGVYYTERVPNANIKWQYMPEDSMNWYDISDQNKFTYTTSSTFTPGTSQTDPFTGVTLKINMARASMDGWQFRAVFTHNDGHTNDTHSARVAGYSGKLTVLPRPITIVHPNDQEVFMDETSTFTSTAQYFKKLGTEAFDVIWQFRRPGGVWANVEASSLFSDATVSRSTVNATSGDTVLEPYLNTTKLTLPTSSINWTNFQFQAVYKFTNEVGTYYFSSAELGGMTKGREGILKVKFPFITATMSGNQVASVRLTTPTPEDRVISSDTVTYTSTITYGPGDTGAGLKTPSVKWQSKSTVSGSYFDWSESVARTLYPKSNITVKINTDPPVSNGVRNEYTVKTTMTMTNLPISMDKDEIHHWFIVDAQTTHLTSDVRVRSESADLTVNCPIEIHHKEYTLVNNGDGSNTYTYGDLEIIAGRGLRQLTVQFTDPRRDSRDTFVLPSTPSGMTRTGNNVLGYTYKSTNGSLISYDRWQSLARQIKWKAYDTGGTPIYWRIDENITNQFYNSETGHFYEYVANDGIQWTQAKVDANGKYNVDLQAVGYLANIETASENSYLTNLRNYYTSDKVWVGGTRENTYTKLGNGVWGWMPAAEPRGNRISYTNWASGEPKSNQYADYMSMDRNGRWIADYNTSTRIVDVRDSFGLNQPEVEGGVYEKPTKAIGSDIGDTFTHSLELKKDHIYYIAQECGKYGDSNQASYFDFDAFNYSSPRPTSMDQHIITSFIKKFTGPTGEYDMVWTNSDVRGPDISGRGSYVWWADVVDLTECFGSGDEPDLAWCEANLMKMIGYRLHQFQFDFDTTDKVGYLVEYGYGGDSLHRAPTMAFDTDIIGGGDTYAKTDLSITITASDKIYNKTETMATVKIEAVDGRNIPASDLSALMAGLNVSYSPGNTVLATAGSGSGAINQGDYTASVSVANSTNTIWSRYKINNSKSTLSTVFTIIPRGVHLVSSGNDKIYDGNTAGTIKNITFVAADADSGIVSGDSISLNAASYAGTYVDKNQTNGQQIVITRNSTAAISLTNNSLGNYYIASEYYTGAIAPRPLHVHSLYLDTLDQENNPRNVKVYDGTNAATITDIIIDNIVEGDEVWINAAEYAGTYATADAGEILNADGTVKENRLNLLQENSITRTDSISLIHNDMGNYYIGSEAYSGAIHRLTIEARVANYQAVYGQGFTETPTTAGTYSHSELGDDTGLTIDQLVPRDSLKIDASKSRFVFNYDITASTPVGMYDISYEGLNETNYAVLSNYVVLNTPGVVAVTPAELTITVAGGYEKTYGETNPQFGVYIDGFVNGDTAASALTGTLRFNTLCATNSDVIYLSDNVTIAAYAVRAYGLECRVNANGGYNYTIEYVDGDIKVNPREITFQALERTKTYGRVDPYFDYVMSRPRVNESDLQVSLERQEGEDVGEYEILFNTHKLTDRDMGNYRITFIPATLTITPKPLVITASDYWRYYGDENPDFAVTYSGFANGDTKETALENTLEIVCNANRLTPVGDYAVSPLGEKVLPNSKGLYNYELVYMDGSLNILPRPITIVADDIVKYAGEEDPDLTWHFADGEMVVDPEGAPLNVDLARQPGEEAYGTYPIYSDQYELDNGNTADSAVKLNAENPNYDITYVPGNLIILKDGETDLVLKVGNATKVYGEEEPSDEYRLIWYMDRDGLHDILPTADVRDIPELKLTGTLQIEADGVSPRDVGVYKINGGGLESGAYENIVFVPGELNVTPRPVTLTPKDATKVYGDPDPVFQYGFLDEISGRFFEDGTDPAARVKPGDLNGRLSRVAGEDVGRYLIRVGTLGDDPNYKVTLERGFLEITPADIIIKVWNHAADDGRFTKHYGDANPAFDVEVQGLKNGDKLTDLYGELRYETEATRDSDIGVYEVEAAGLWSDNYNVFYIEGELEILPKNLMLIIDDKTKVYGQEDPIITWRLPVGEEILDDLEVKITREPGEDVDWYVIEGTVNNEDYPNYNIIVYPGTLAIIPAKLQVIAHDKTKVYGDANPEWTYEITGFVEEFGDDESVLSGEVVYLVKEADGVTDVGVTTDVGEYPINISDESTLAADNYVVEYKDANLTITKRPLVVTPGDDTRDLSIVKTANRSKAEVGDVIEYTLVVTNTGNVELENIPVKDESDAAGQISAKNGQGYRYNGDGTFTIYRLPAGRQVTIKYTYTVQAEDLGKTILNVATATIPGIPGEPGTGPEDPGKPEVPPVDVPSNEVEVDIEGGQDPGPGPGEDTRGLSITKEVNAAFAKVGDILRYTVTLTNTGTIDLENVAVADSMQAAGGIVPVASDEYSYEGGGRFMVPYIAAGQTVRIQYDYTVLAADDDTIITNVAVASIPPVEEVPGDPDDPENPGTPGWPGEEVPSEELEVPVIPDPDEPGPNHKRNLEIDKSADKNKVNVGETINYTITVRNTGDVDLYDIPVHDQNSGAGEVNADSGRGYTYEGDGRFIINYLPAGNSIEIRYSYTALEEDLGTDIENTAMVTIPADPDDPDSEDEDKITPPVIVPVVPRRGLEIEKAADRAEVSVGETITYTVTVRNTGDVDIHDIPVNDSNSGAGAIIAASGEGYTYEDGRFLIPLLKVGQAIEIHYTYTAVEADVGTDIENVAVATLPADPDDPDGEDVEKPTPPVIVPVKPHRALEITKAADKTVVSVGEVINYLITVKNTGEADLYNIRVSDNNNGAAGINAASGSGYTYEGYGKFLIPQLASGETVEIRYTYTANEADMGADIVNVAVATLPADPDDPDGKDEDKTTPPVIIPVKAMRSIEIEKMADIAFAKVGGIINYTVRVTNTGMVDITNIPMQDTSNGAGAIYAADGPGYTYLGGGKFNIGLLKAGESIEIHYSYTVLDDDAGKTILNVAVATLPGDPENPSDPDREIPSEEVEVPVDEKGPITIIPDPYIKVYGDEDPELSYKIGEPLVKPGDVWGNVEREPGEDVGTYPINQGTVDSDNYEIIFIPGEFYIIPAPLIITANDARRPVFTENPTFSAIYEGFKFQDTPEDLDGSLLIDTPATYDSSVGRYPITPSGHSSRNYDIYYIDGTLTVYDNADLLIEKTADKASLEVGETVTYTVTVTNTGGRNLTDLLIRDTLSGAAGSIDAKDGAGYEYEGEGVFRILSLPVGETVVITYTYTALEEDAGAVITNVAIGELPDKPVITPPVVIPVDNRDISIVKSVNKTVAKPGDILTYTLDIRNTGEVTLTDLIVTDDSDGHGSVTAEDGEGYEYLGGSKFKIKNLAPGAQIRITYQYLVSTADVNKTVKNIAVVTLPPVPEVPGNPDDPDDNGTPEIPGREYPSNEVEVDIVDRRLEIVKTADKSIVKVGETITYTIEVHNTGATVIVDVEVKDITDAAGPITVIPGAGYTYEGGIFHIAKLEPGQKVMIRYTIVAQEEDAGGQITNVAVAEVPPVDPENPEPPVITPPVIVGVDGRDLRITKTADRETAKVGDTILYTLLLENTGSIDLADFRVRDGMNAAGEIEAKAGEGYTYKDGLFHIEYLAVGDTLEIQYSYVALQADAGNIVTNIAVATLPPVPAEKEDPNDPEKPVHPGFPEVEYPSEEVLVPITDGDRRDMAMQKSVSQKTAMPGDVLQYNIRVVNTGNVALENVLVKDTMTGAAGKIKAEASELYSYDGNGVFTIPRLDVGQTINIRYTYTVLDADKGKEITNTAIGTIPPDPDTEEPGKEVEPPPVVVPVDGREFTISKKADKSSAPAGEDINYTVTVKNTGTVDITDLLVEDHITNASGTIKVQPDGRYQYKGNGTFFIPELKAGETLEIKYSYHVLDVDAGKTITNVAIGKLPELPVDPANPGGPKYPGREVPSKEVQVEIEEKSVIVQPPEERPAENPKTGRGFWPVYGPYIIFFLLAFGFSMWVITFYDRKKLS